jgi:hypothetical protein
MLCSAELSMKVCVLLEFSSALGQHQCRCDPLLVP